MKNYLKIFGFMTLALVITLVSCKKDEDDQPSTQDYLTAGNWKTTAMTIDPAVEIGGTEFTDFYAMMPACTKDDLVRFNTDGTITEDEGETKCEPDDPQTTTDGTWELSADNTTLTLTYPDEDPIIMTINSINNTDFNATYTMTEDFGSGTEDYAVTVNMMLQ